MTTHQESQGCVFSIGYSRREPAFRVDFPEFRDVVTNGATLAEDFAIECKALDLRPAGMAKLKMSPPEPKHRLVVEAS